MKPAIQEHWSSRQIMSVGTLSFVSICQNWDPSSASAEASKAGLWYLKLRYHRQAGPVLPSKDMPARYFNSAANPRTRLL